MLSIMKFLSINEYKNFIKYYVILIFSLLFLEIYYFNLREKKIKKLNLKKLKSEKYLFKFYLKSLNNLKNMGVYKI
jgi:hypothetical protein